MYSVVFNCEAYGLRQEAPTQPIYPGLGEVKTLA